jgi:hypothetical protein
MGLDIQLDGAEISIIKAIGIGGGDIDGTTLIERCDDLEPNELIDTLRGLIDQGYVDADTTAFYSTDEMADMPFRVNSGYAKDLKEALDEKPKPKKSKRVRRE